MVNVLGVILNCPDVAVFSSEAGNVNNRRLGFFSANPNPLMTDITFFILPVMSNHTFRNSYFLFFSTTFLCWECKRSNKKIRCSLLQKRDAEYAAIQRQGQSETERWNWIRVTHRKRKGERGCLVWSDFTFSSRKVDAASAERLFLPYQTIILSFMRRCHCHIISSHIFFKN